MFHKVTLYAFEPKESEPYPPETLHRVLCPFCGSTNLRLKPVWREYHFVSCLDCKAAGPVKKIGDDAWRAWATRVVDSR